MIDNCNIENLAKNQVSAVFHRALFVEVCYPNLQSFVWRRHVCALQRDTDMAAGNQQKHLSLTYATKT